MTLGARIAATLVILVAIVAVALAGVAYVPLSNSIYAERLASLRSSARLLVQDFSGMTRNAAADVRLIARAPGVREMIEARWAGDAASEAEGRARLQALMLSFMDARPEYVQARLIGADPEGREIVRVDRAAAGAPPRILANAELQSKANRDYYIAAMAKPPGEIYVSAIDLNREHGEIVTPHMPVVRVAMPVFLPNGAPFGVVVVNIDMRPALTRAKQAVDDATDVWMADGLGRYLVHPEPDRAFGFEFGDAGRIVDDFPDLELVDGDFILAAQPLRGRTTAAAVRSEDRSGQPLALSAAVDNLGDGRKVLLLLSTRPATLIAAGRQALGRYAIAGAAATLLAIALGLVMARSIALPLRRLGVSLRRLSRGEPASFLEGGPPEIQALIGAFNRYVERESLYRAVAESASDAIITVSRDGMITSWNPAAQRIFGYSASEIIGRSALELAPAETRKDNEAIARQVEREGAAADAEMTLITKDGRRIQAHRSISLIRSSEGEAIGRAAIVRDITAQRRADQLFEAAVESAPAAVILVDANGEIVLANHETRAMFGYAAAELMEKRIEVLVPTSVRDGHPALRAAYGNAPARRRMGAGRDLNGMRKDGSLFPVEVGLNPVTLPGGENLTLAVVVDITERKEAERALNERTMELERSNEELKQFAYITSHDLQEPLRMVSSFCSLLKEEYGDKLDQDASDYIDFAVDGATRMRQMISDLLDYSRLQSQDFGLEPLPADDALDEAIRNLAASIVESGADIARDALPTVQGHRRLLTQLFQNLLSNAIKFRGAETPRIHVSAERADGMWRFAVKDNGIGIDPRHAETIFRVFQRLHTGDEYPGTGIGLAQCKRIAERHGGDIWVEKNDDAGSTFYFTLEACDAGGDLPQDDGANRETGGGEQR